MHNTFGQTWFDKGCPVCMLLCFIDPRVKKIRNEAVWFVFF